MINLYHETVDKLREFGKRPENVLFIKNRGVRYEWKEFARVAYREYNNDYGVAGVNMGLMIVGKDWWLERAEYDGKEWWVFKTMPSKPKVLECPTVREIFNI